MRSGHDGQCDARAEGSLGIWHAVSGARCNQRRLPARQRARGTRGDGRTGSRRAGALVSVRLGGAQRRRRLTSTRVRVGDQSTWPPTATQNRPSTSCPARATRLIPRQPAELGVWVNAQGERARKITKQRTSGSTWARGAAARPAIDTRAARGGKLGRRPEDSLGHVPRRLDPLKGSSYAASAAAPSNGQLYTFRRQSWAAATVPNPPVLCERHGRQCGPLHPLPCSSRRLQRARRGRHAPHVHGVRPRRVLFYS
jgi:hypothetical protein